MAEFKWISLFLIAALQFTAAERLSFTVRVGDEVTLPCENVTDGQRKCDSTTWLFVGSGYTAVVELVRLGQIGENAKAKSDRLSVTASCSLLIKKVAVEDVGYYTCRQFRSGQHQDVRVRLFLINMTEHKDPDKVTLTCSVLTSGQCGHTVKWLYEGKDVAEGNKDMETSQTDCYASVSFLDSHFIYTSRSNLLKCEVTDTYSGKVQQFPFSSQSAGEKPGWWWLIIVAVGVAALLIIVVVVIRWKRTKGKKTQMDENTGLSVNTAVTPETSQDTADPEDGVSYASISYTRKTNSKARVLGKDDDEDEAVTYTTVKASSSSAGASADPSNLYATVNKPNKEESTV
ncbi:uncharacterized protein LOC122863064 isoform X2 [Siniperca chuatsi]|uniref:uncharacterized protein LOC122863064 isoform X2 n=1 Tax=Siniperca chuatsi TaxID=119488 RepID=UPI001CE18EF1|nr:uncharacterized protein LOC122863064 isoform X2 [Siniperca chuatsi]